MSAIKTSNNMQKNAKVLTDASDQAGMNNAIIRITKRYFKGDLALFTKWFDSEEDDKLCSSVDGIIHYEKDLKRCTYALHHRSKMSDDDLRSIIAQDKIAIHRFKHTPNTAWCIIRKLGFTSMLRPLDIFAIIGTIKHHTDHWDISYITNVLQYYEKYAPLLARLTAPMTLRESEINQD